MKSYQSEVIFFLYRNTDEVCIKVKILANHTTTTPSILNPKIISPSMANGSVLQCELGEESCHIPLYTTPTKGSTKCPDIENMASSSTPNVHAFSSLNNLGSVCHLDLSVKPKRPGNHTLCVRAKDKNNDGDVRCYTIQVVTNNNKTFGGPCQDKHCHNGGRCEADPVSWTAQCICPVEISDSNCLTNTTVPGTTTPTIPSHTFTDTAIPNVIQCPINTECGIPLIITGPPGDIPDVKTNSPLVHKPIPTINYPGHSNSTYQTNIKVSGTKEELKKICVEIGTKGAEICVKVNITSKHTPSANSTKSIQEPTIPDESSVVCVENTVCHLLIHSTKFNNDSCTIPRQSQVTPGTVVLKTAETTFNQSLCVTDVATLVKPGENKKICVETFSSDRRCIIVNAVKNITSSSPCNPNPCQGEGFCRTSDYVNHTCVCKTGLEGQNCEKKDKPLPIPRQNTTLTNELPVFVDTMLPKEIVCYLAQDCPIILPVDGQPLNRSSLLFGHIDKGISPKNIELEHITSPLNQSIAQFHVLPSESGTKHVCVQTRNSNTNTDEVCIKIIILPNVTATSPPSTMSPKITSPSMPNGTVLQCEYGEKSCHIPLFTNPIPGSSKCPDVENTAFSSISNTHAFSSENSQGSSLCHVDLSVKPEVPGIHTLCVRVGNKTNDGDVRCYTIQVVTKNNKTFDTTVPGTTMPTISTHTFTDTAIPNVIQCPINTECGIPLIITGPPGEIPEVKTNSPLVHKPIPTVNYPGHSNSTYQTNIKVSGTKEELQKICVQIGTKGDKVCFKVNITSKHTLSSNAAKIIQEPTIPDESSVICIESTVCHLLIHSVKFNNDSCTIPRQFPVTTGTVVLNTAETTFNQSLCVTDVATLVKPGENKKICVETFSSDRRCIMVNAVKNITSSSPCNPNPCQGNGFCRTSDYVNHTCVCKTGLEGQNCEKKVKPLPIPRKNTTSTNELPIFVDTMLPKKIVCYLAQDCPIILPVDGQPLNRSSLLFGHIDKGISPKNIELEHITSPLNQSIAQFHVLPSESGTKHVCVQTRNSNTNTDEVCIKILILPNVTVTSPPSTMSPKIASPSMPNGTVLQCEYGEKSCHIPLFTTPIPGSSKCPHVENTATSSIANTHAFSSENSQGSSLCHVDLSIKPEVPGIHTLCVRVGNKTASGDIRCYTVHVVTNNNKTFGGPCQQMRCHNGGKCETDPLSSTAQCICPVGYSDTNCLSHINISPTFPGPTVPTTTKPIFTETAIPDIIQCPTGSTCSVPLIIKGESGNIPQIDTDSPLVTHPIQTVTYPGKTNDTFQTNIKMSSLKEGVHTVCTHIVDNREKGDEICFKVNFTSPVTTVSTGNPLKFQEPTIPDMSSVNCLENKTCHVLLHAPMDNNGNCLIPRQAPFSSGTTVLTTSLTTFDHTLCVTDIATIVKHSETKKLCFEVNGSADKRCIAVNAVTNLTKSHCNSKPCGACGYCKSTSTSYVCICKLGYKGMHCENTTQPIPVPRPSNKFSNSSPIFVNTMLPKEITCHLNKDCPIMLPVHGSPVNKSSLLFGHLDKGVEPKQINLIDFTKPVNQSIAQFHVIPSQTGTKLVCVQTKNSMTNTDEICVNVKIIPDNTLSTTTPLATPEIVSPSLPDGTVLQCESALDSCHIQLVTKPTPGSQSCPRVENTPTSSLVNIHDFTSETVTASHSVCYTDLSVKPSAPGNHSLCIRARQEEKVGDERCYIIQVVTNGSKTYGGPCQDQHCYNGGRCDATSASKSTCICPVGITGSTCQKSRFSPPVNQGNTGKQNNTVPVFTDTAIPEVIQCSIGTPCGVPLIVTGPPGDIPTVDTDSPFVIHPVKTDTFPGDSNSTYQTNIKLKATKEGQRKICINTVHKSLKGDEICFKVNFTSALPTKPPSSGLQEPTLPDSSSVRCLENTDCHLLIHTSKDHSGKCEEPKELPHTSGTVIVSTKVTSFDPNLCVTDVVTRVQHTETKKICIGAQSSNVKRCIIVNPSLNSTTSHCQHVSCNKGYCFSNDQSFTCICPVGVSGRNCQNNVSHIPIPRNPSANITANSTIFVDTGVPTDINCVLNLPCEFPLPISGQNLS
ncbi:mucin-2-like, partial [Saccostrea cucullata]|uniref:mucin-2-like n=1 Tax=Saccostrea cuccullata TaxID=36930 RepID=UPI002ED617BC